MNQEVHGQKINIGMTIGSSMAFLVKNINDNNYEMDVKFEKLVMSMQMPQAKMEFSSEKKDDNDVYSKVLRAMKGRTFEVTMSKSGKITEVRNIEALYESVISQFVEISKKKKEQIKAQIENSYGVDALKRSIEMSTAIYPEKPVKKGDKWTVNTKLKTGMSANISTDYEFVDFNSDYALIRGKSIIKTDEEDTNVENKMIPMKLDVTGSMNSEIKVDKKTGWIIEAKINQEINGGVSFKLNSQMSDQMKMTIKMINKMLITD